MIEKTNLIAFGEEKLYNVVDIIKDFELYFGLTLNEATNLILNYQIISKEEIINYLENNLDKIQVNTIISKENIIKTNLTNYQYYNQLLALLTEEGNNYLNILNYLNQHRITINDEFNIKQEYENLLNQYNIYHFKSVVTGKDLKRILNSLIYILNNIENILLTINNIENYNIYSSKKLILLKENNKMSILKI